MVARIAIVAALGVIGGACELLTGPEEVIGAVAAVEVPDTVQAGVPFVVRVTTHGSNGCWRKARTHVAVDNMTATIVPYDVEDRAHDEGCPTAVVEIEHEANVTFGQTGTGTLVVQGRGGTGADAVVVVQ